MGLIHLSCLMNTSTVCTNSFCSGLFLQGCLYTKQPWKTEIVYPFLQNRRLNDMIKIMHPPGVKFGQASCIHYK